MSLGLRMGQSGLDKLGLQALPLRRLRRGL